MQHSSEGTHRARQGGRGFHPAPVGDPAAGHLRVGRGGRPPLTQGPAGSTSAAAPRRPLVIPPPLSQPASRHPGCAGTPPSPTPARASPQRSLEVAALP